MYAQAAGVRELQQGRIHVWSKSAPAPLLTDKSCKFSLFQVIFGLFSGYISHPAPSFYISWIHPCAACIKMQ